jgi:hypothetical protein
MIRMKATIRFVSGGTLVLHGDDAKGLLEKRSVIQSDSILGFSKTQVNLRNVEVIEFED